MPGVAVALIQNGAITAEGGFGFADLSSQRRAGANTPWPIASVTKSFTAVLAMQLAEQGSLDLDAPVTDYLADLCVADARRTQRLSVRRLLSHAGGLGRTGHQDRTREEQPNPFPTREALLAALHEVKPQAPVGQCFSYSNESYAIVGKIIETLSGKPLERCYQEHIFEPLQMRGSAVSFATWRSDPNRAYLYAGAEIGPYGSGQRHGDYEVVELVEDYQTFLSTGGIVSTAHDLALYQLASMNYVDSPLGLSAPSLEHMQSVQHRFGDSNCGYGLGYWVLWHNGLKVFGHSGGLPGVSTYSMLIPSEQTGAVVLTNRSDIKAMVLAELLLNDLRGELWRASPAEPFPVATKVPLPSGADLAEYTGDYVFRRGPARVEAGPQGVIVQTPSRYDGPVRSFSTRRVARDRFVMLSDAHIVDFVRDEQGAIRGFLNSGYL